jgi:tight adherence protein B
MQEALIVDGAVVAAVGAFLAGLYFLLSGMRAGDEKIVERRLGELGKPGWKMPQLRRRSLSRGKSPWLASILETASLKSFDNLVATSGMRTSTERVLFLTVIATAVIFEVLDVVAGFNLLVCAAGALLLGVGAPLLWILNTRRRRVNRIVAQLPDALDMLVRSLRAGHPVPTGVGLVAREMNAPIATEFAGVYDEMSYGVDLRQSFEKMSQRLRVVEIDYMIAAMRIQSSTGGNLAEVLAALSNVMREKVKLKAKIMALSAEARFSGMVLAALPILVVIALYLLNPHYYDIAKDNPVLKGILGAAAVLMAAGIVLVRKIVHIRV